MGNAVFVLGFKKETPPLSTVGGGAKNHKNENTNSSHSSSGHISINI